MMSYLHTGNILLPNIRMYAQTLSLSIHASLFTLLLKVREVPIALIYFHHRDLLISKEYNSHTFNTSMNHDHEHQPYILSFIVSQVLYLPLLN